MPVANAQPGEFIVAGHQSHYLPWLGYINKIYQADAFCLVDSVQYKKKDVHNRNKIKTPNGETWLTVPVLTKGAFEQNLNEVRINNNIPWRRKHWKSICLAYEKAPFFSQYADFFQDTYEREWEYLVDINEHIILGLLDFFGIKKDIVKSSSFAPHGAKTDLLLDITKAMKADGYLSGTGGAKEYVDLSKFEQAKLAHYFQEFSHPVYPQIHGEFKPYMSAIDLLFNCGPDSIVYIQQASTA